MKEKIVNAFVNLLKVKTLVTLSLTVVFCILALKNVISGTEFIQIFTVIIAFYFGTQKVKE
jgi:hypothetical protein